MAEWSELRADLQHAIDLGRLYGDQEIPAAVELVRLIDLGADDDSARAAAMYDLCELAKQQIRDAMARLSNG